MPKTRLNILSEEELDKEIDKIAEQQRKANKHREMNYLKVTSPNDEKYRMGNGKLHLPKQQ